MITFKYKDEPTSSGEKISRPVGEVFLKTKSNFWIKFNPYIDSGADITLVPLSLGRLLGFMVDEKKIQEIGGIRGTVPIIYFKNKMRIGNVEMFVRIGWALIEEVPPLLGRTDVFDFFNITFRQKEGKITFEKLRYR